MVKIATIFVFPLTPWAKQKSTYRQWYFFVISTKTRQGLHQLSIRWPFSRHCFYNDTSQCELGHRSIQSAANTCVTKIAIKEANTFVGHPVSVSGLTLPCGRQ